VIRKVGGHKVHLHTSRKYNITVEFGQDDKTAKERVDGW
jgi:hypothetical protein